MKKKTSKIIEIRPRIPHSPQNPTRMGTGIRDRGGSAAEGLIAVLFSIAAKTGSADKNAAKDVKKIERTLLGEVC
jgi:hypothetical protein